MRWHVHRSKYTGSASPARRVALTTGTRPAYRWLMLPVGGSLSRIRYQPARSQLWMLRPRRFGVPPDVLLALRPRGHRHRHPTAPGRHLMPLRLVNGSRGIAQLVLVVQRPLKGPFVLGEDSIDVVGGIVVRDMDERLGRYREPARRRACQAAGSSDRRRGPTTGRVQSPWFYLSAPGAAPLSAGWRLAGLAFAGWSGIPVENAVYLYQLIADGPQLV
jgi:hypothetical protein